jgi:hypothetical protein
MRVVTLAVGIGLIGCASGGSLRQAWTADPPIVDHPATDGSDTFDTGDVT